MVARSIFASPVRLRARWSELKTRLAVVAQLRRAVKGSQGQSNALGRPLSNAKSGKERLLRSEMGYVIEMPESRRASDVLVKTNPARQSDDARQEERGDTAQEVSSLGSHDAYSSN